MARNAVQFQKGLSFSEFNARYGTEEQCHAALVAMRWPDGFQCPKCGCRKYSYAKARRHFQCSACRVQTSAKAGTIFHKSKTPLTKWFLAMHLITSAKNDISGLELGRQLGVKWDTGWLIKQKLMEVMRQRNSIYKLDGDVQIDDAYLGGAKPRKTGRGAGNKDPFVIAVATRDGKPTFMQLRRVAAFTKEAIRQYGKANILGTCCSCDPQHADRHLAAYEWRFNRRFDLALNFHRLARVAIATAPVPYRIISPARRMAELPG